MLLQRPGALHRLVPKGQDQGGDTNAVDDTDLLFVEVAPGRSLEVQYGRDLEVFGWHQLEADQGRHNVPMPAPGDWTLQVRRSQGPVTTFLLRVAGRWAGVKTAAQREDM